MANKLTVELSTNKTVQSERRKRILNFKTKSFEFLKRLMSDKIRDG